MIVAGIAHPVVPPGGSALVGLDRLLAGLPRGSRRIAGAIGGSLVLTVDAQGRMAARLDLRRPHKPTLHLPAQHLAAAATGLVDLALKFATASARASRVTAPDVVTVVGDGARLVAEHRDRVRREAKAAARARAAKILADAKAAKAAEARRRQRPAPSPTPAQQDAALVAEISGLMATHRSARRAP